MFDVQIIGDRLEDAPPDPLGALSWNRSIWQLCSRLEQFRSIRVPIPLEDLVLLLRIPVKKGLPEIGTTMDLEPDTIALIVNLATLIVFVSFVSGARWKKQSD
jgi:hypothetical protein